MVPAMPIKQPREQIFGGIGRDSNLEEMIFWNFFKLKAGVSPPKGPTRGQAGDTPAPEGARQVELAA